MATFTVFGGHGRVALRLARILGGRGDTVVSVIRDPDHADEVRAAGGDPVVLDLESADVDAMAELLTGSDGVVWAAGAGGGSPERTYAVDRDAAIRSIDAAARAGVERYVMVSYQGSGPDHGVPADDAFFPYAEAKAAADAHLRESGLKWTVLGPGSLTDEQVDDPTMAVGAVMQDRDDRDTARDLVAAVAAAVLCRPDTVNRTIDFTDGPTPIGEALTRE